MRPCCARRANCSTDISLHEAKQTVTDYILTLRCNNRSGIVAAVAARIARHGGDIFEAHQFDDPATGMFFMRVGFKMDAPEAEFRAGIAAEVASLKLDFSLRPA